MLKYLEHEGVSQGRVTTRAFPRDIMSLGQGCQTTKLQDIVFLIRSDKNLSNSKRKYSIRDMCGLSAKVIMDEDES